MAAFSKVYNNLEGFLKFLNTNSERRIASISGVLLVLLLVKMKKSHKESLDVKGFQNNKKQGEVNGVFIARLMKLLKIVIPSWKESVVFDLFTMTCFLVVRTMLSIYISSVNGDIVRSMVNYEFDGFIKNLSKLLGLALPASFINSLLEYMNKIIALKFRKNMTSYFHKMYIKDMIYY